MHESEDHGIVDATDAINENQDVFPVKELHPVQTAQ